MVFDAGTPVAGALHDLYLLWKQTVPYVPTLHDPMAVGMLLDPAMCQTRQLAVQVGADGMTRAVDGAKPNALVGVNIDPSRFIDFYVQRVAR
jgi:purine nucleosidase